MKAVIVVCFVALACALARPEEKYTNRYDSLNIHTITGNPKLMTKYIDCCMDRGKCTAEGKELKSHISDALENQCAKCTDAQKKAVEEVIRFLINNMPEAWEELKAKYDPSGKYSEKYEDHLKKFQA